MREPITLVEGVMARRWEITDADAVFPVVERNRERLAPWMPWVPQTHSVSDIRAFMRAAHERYLQGTAVDLGVFEGDTVIGGFGATIGVMSRDEADIGYWLAEVGEGRGIASAAAGALIAWLFAERGMHRIIIRAAVDNARSRTVAERLGFTFEGILREAITIGAEHRDAALYSLLRHEWRAT